MSFSRDYASHVRSFSPNARLFLVATALWALGQALLGVTRNLYLKQSGYNEAEIGNFLSAVQLGAVFCTIPAAVLLDRWRMKPLLILAVLVTMAGNVGTALLAGRNAVAVASFVAGAGSAIFGVASSPFYARNSTPSERGHLFGVSIGGSAFAGTIGTLAVAPLEHWLGHGTDALRTMMLCGALGGLLAVAPMVLIAETAVATVRRHFRDFLLARDWRTTVKLCLPDALVGCGAGLTIPFINLYFQGRFGRSASEISYFFAASSAMNMVGFFLAPVIAQRFGRIATIAGSQLLSIPFFAALAFSPWLSVSVTAFLLRSLLMNMSQPVASAFVMDMAAADQQAVTNSMKQLSWNAAWTVSASAGGWMIHHVTLGRDGYTLPMLCTIGLYMVGSGLLIV
ncbi:MAG: MFS transporter, partial [Planctomycetes bacterium]|nr:MFS transporter [Planctomycetota bacterium]